MRKRGQVTIFIIIAIVIIALALLIYFLYPRLKGGYSFEGTDPQGYLKNCLEDQIKEGVGIIAENGGSLEPELTYTYKGKDIEYLCYTDQYYDTCVVQTPLLSNHVSQEIEEYIEGDVRDCMDSLVDAYQGKGYSVDLRNPEFGVDFLPERIVVNFNHSLTVTKTSSTKYDDLKIVIPSEMYSLLGIATNIVQWETRYGDSETTTYMNYYRDIKVEKKKQSDGTTVYILTNRDSGTKFQFASRSVAWPPGYSG